MRSKLRHDPVHRAILDRAATEPLGEVVDLGCGRGQLALALLEAGLADAVTGIDWDAGLLATAERAGAGLAARFSSGDLRTAAVPACDTALIVDVLVQMPAEAQLGLLRRAAAAARRCLLVRAFDPDRGWRSRVGLLMEGGLWTLGAYRRASIRPLPIATLTGTLDGAGFATAVETCWGHTPLPNVLLVARRRSAAA